MSPNAAPTRPPSRHMVWIPGGAFQMGSNDFYPEERPAHRVTVDGFWMDEHPVTNAEFRRFVKASGYCTMPERAPDPAAYPDADPALLVPGSLVFRQPHRPVSLDDYHAWWAYVEDRALQWSDPAALAGRVPIEQEVTHCVAALDALLVVGP